MQSTTFLSSVVALGAVLLLIVVLGRVAGRFRLPFLVGRQDGRHARLALRSSLAIDPKRRLVIIACDGREGLLLVGPHGDVLLGWIDGAGEAAP